MELAEVMRTTFAAREYTDAPLPDAVLHDILETARFAPSGGNRQGNRVIVVRDGETKARIAELAAPAAKRYAAQILAGENPWNTIVPPGVSAAQIADTPAPMELLSAYTSAPVLLVFCVDLKVVASMDQELERIGVISGASIYPFVWNVLLCAREAGFGGTITTLPAAREAEMQALLNVPADHAVAAVVPLGQPVRQLTRLKRRPVSEIASRERFDGAPFTAD